MSVHLVFEKKADTYLKRAVKQLTGPYVHTEIIITTAHEDVPHIRRVAYSAYVDDVFSSTGERAFQFTDETHDFLQIPVSVEDIELIRLTCETHAQLETRYNLKDMILSIIPLRAPKEITIFEAKSLFCSQAMVLILRGCLRPEHSVVEALKDVNSRTISPAHLFAVLSPVCERVFSKQVVRRI